MKRLVLPLLVSLVVVGLFLAPPPAAAGHSEDFHSPNMTHLANVAGKPGVINSDLAFWDKLAFAGDFAGFRIFHVADPSKPVLLADVVCNGPQGDVGVWGNLLFVSVDTPQDKETCDSRNAPATDLERFEGIRIFDVSNPRRPVFVKAVNTNCGSHTHTVVPDLANDRVLIYVSSSLVSVSPTCRRPSIVSVVEVPIGRPVDAAVIREFDVAPAEGCHDIGVFLAIGRAAGACINVGQIWDISDVANPRILKNIENPDVEIWHSATFTWDGRIAIFGDEHGGGSVAQGGCTNTDTKFGRMWFYDRNAVEQAATSAVPSSPPFLISSFKIPRSQGADEICTAHNYNVIPLKGRYLAASGWYEGGTSVVDFTNPANPREVGFYDQRRQPSATAVQGAWSSYWFNGIIYSNDIDLGFWVFRFLDRDVKKAVVLHHLNPQTQESAL